jgi:hypothetical protein
MRKEGNMKRTPWHTRLDDVAQLIKQARDTYFKPKLFRLNCNNAISTLRTVTFVMQKNKDKIPDFDKIYKSHVLSSKDNKIMEWLKDARNSIEKEGDLELHSELTIKILFSYTVDGPEIQSCPNLLFEDTKTLWKEWQKIVPPHIVQDSAIVTQRSWRANTLPDYELLDAIIYGYNFLRSGVRALDKAIGYPELPLPAIPPGEAKRREYIKLFDGATYVSKSLRKNFDPSRADLSNAKQEKLDSIKAVGQFVKPGATFTDKMNALIAAAINIFNLQGYHLPAFFKLDKEGSVIDIGSVHFADRVDKFIFWHEVSEHAATDPQFSSIFFVAEAWLKQGDSEGFDIQNLPVVGEVLTILGLSSNGDYAYQQYPIIRNGESAEASTTPIPSTNDGFTNVLVPLRRAWGLADYPSSPT